MDPRWQSTLDKVTNRGNRNLTQPDVVDPRWQSTLDKVTNRGNRNLTQPDAVDPRWQRTLDKVANHANRNLAQPDVVDPRWQSTLDKVTNGGNRNLTQPDVVDPRWQSTLDKLENHGKTAIDDLRYETVFGNRRRRRKEKLDPAAVITDNGKVHLNKMDFDYLFGDKPHKNTKTLTPRSVSSIPYFGYANIILSFKTSSKLGEISKICPISENRAWVISVGDTHLTLINKDGRRLNVTPDFENSIWDFAISIKGKLVLTVDRSSHVHAISPNGETSMAGNFLGYQPYGITVMEEGSLLVCMRPTQGIDVPGKLAMIGVTGEVLHQFEWRDDDTPLFSDPYNVACTSNRKIFVRDGNSKIVCIDTKGNHLYTWTNQSFDDSDDAFLPSCLTSDSHGSLLVSSRDSDKVYILPTDGNGLGCLVDGNHGIQRPLGMGVDGNGHLWMACKDRIIHVLKYDTTRSAWALISDI